MPKALKERRSTINRVDGSDPAKSPTTTLSQRLRAPKRQGQGTEQFLGRLATFAGGKALKDKQEKIEADAAQGAATVAAGGEADPELMASSQLYADSVNETSGAADAFKLSVDIQTAAEEAQAKAKADGVEWSAETFWSERAAPMLESEEFKTGAYAQGASPIMEKTRAALVAQESALNAGMKLEQATSNISSLAMTSVQSGQLDLKTLDQYAQKDGVNKTDFVNSWVTGVEAAFGISKDGEKVDAAFKVSMAGLTAKQKVIHGKSLKTARDRALSRIKTANTKSKTAKTVAEHRALLAHKESAKDPATNSGQLKSQLEEEGFDIGDINSVMALNVKTQNEDAITSASQADTAAIATGLKDIPTDPDQLAEHKTNLNTANSKFGTAITEAVQAYSRSSNPTQQDEAQNAVFKAIDDAHQFTEGSSEVGVIPKWIKNNLDSSKVATTGDLKGGSMLLAALTTRYGNQILADVNGEAVANLREYRTLTRDLNRSDEEARKYLEDRINGMTVTQAGGELGKTEEFETFMSDNSDLIEANPGYEDHIKMIASQQFRITGNAEKAFAHAKEVVDGSYTEIDGSLMPRGVMSPQFADYYKDKKDLAIEALVSMGAMAEGDKMKLVNTGDVSTNSQFALHNRTTGEWVKNPETGVALHLNPAGITSLINRYSSQQTKELFQQETIDHRINSQKKLDTNDALREQMLNAPAGIEGKGSVSFVPEKDVYDPDKTYTRNDHEGVNTGGIGLLSRLGFMKFGAPDPLDNRDIPKAVRKEVEAKLKVAKVHQGTSFVGLPEGVTSAMTAQIIRHEDNKASVYTDSVGVKTVGFGTNLEEAHVKNWFEELGIDHEAVITGQQKLTDHESRDLFRKSVSLAYDDAAKAVSSFKDQPEAVREIMVNMSYNLGATKLRKFTNTIKAINDRDYAKAAEEMKDSDWFTQVGSRSQELVSAMAALAN